MVQTTPPRLKNEPTNSSEIFEFHVKTLYNIFFRFRLHFSEYIDAGYETASFGFVFSKLCELGESMSFVSISLTFYIPLYSQYSHVVSRYSNACDLRIRTEAHTGTNNNSAIVHWIK